MKPLCAILGFLSASAALVLGASSAEAATSLSSTPNACWTTEQPFTLLENEYSKLTWDVYGNLTFTNHNGNGSSISWGLDSSVPLTGSNAGKLCFGNGSTRLRIHDSTGATVWNSGIDHNGQPTYSTPNGTLNIDECTIQMKSTSGAVVWEESLPQCELRSRKKPAVTQCWSKNDSQLILSDEELGLELHWQGGNLWLRGQDGVNRSLTIPNQNTKELCHQSNGDLVIFHTNGTVLRHLGYGENISLDECGIEFWSDWNLPDYSRPHKLIRQRTEVMGACTRSPAIEDAVCYDTSAAGIILESGFTRLDWTSVGRLKMLDTANNELWSSDNVQNDRFCVMDDGRLRFYKHNGFGNIYVATSTTEGASGAQVPGEGYSLELKSNVLRLKTASVDKQCLEDEVLGIRKDYGIYDYDEWCGDGWLWDHTYWLGYSMRYPWIAKGEVAAEPLPGGGYSFVKEWHGGNSNFGAASWLVAGALNEAGLQTFRDRVESTGAEDEVFAALPTTGLPSNYVEAIADGGASVTLFGQPYKLVEGIASAEINDGPKDMVKMMVGGAMVYSSSAFGVLDQKVTQEFFSQDAQLYVGPIPITATFEVTGSVGMRGNMDYNQNSNMLTCTVTPYASVDAFGSIGFGVIVVSAGVEGELNLVSVGFPLTNELNTETLRYEAKSDVNISTLEGSLSLYANATLVKYTKEVASFDGYSASSTLFKVNGTLGN